MASQIFWTIRDLIEGLACLIVNANVATRVVDPDPDPGGHKMTQKNECSLLRAEGFSCSLDVLYGGK
jgi:hypothetical protein